MHAYQDMRDSGTPWLGDIPTDWALNRIGQLFTQRNEKVSDKDYVPLSVTKNGVVPQLENAAKSNDGDNRKKVLSGDYVINSRSDRKGSSGLSELDGSVSLINIVLSPGKLTPKYTHHLLRSYAFQEEFYRWGQGIVADLWSTNYQRMKSIQLPVPDDQTQQRIADYLDKETAKIDSLITKQERLLKLLDEKRQATITNAVTFGLDPKAEKKETNIPWLKYVPSHWQVTRLKYIASLKTGGTPKNNVGINQEEDGLPWYTPADFSSTLELKNSSKFINQKALVENKIKTFPAPSILFVGIGATVGKIGITNRESYSNQQITAVIPKQINPDFLKYFLHSITEVMKSVASYATLPIVNNLFLSTFTILVPPVDEQNMILNTIRQEEIAFGKLCDSINIHIKLLKERRVSLISSVVTGKLKV